jgi:transposase
MTSPQAVFVGIDVGKRWLDVALWEVEGAWRFQNDEAGVQQLRALLKPYEVALIVVEATGGYEQRAVQAFQLAGLPVSVVNPTRVRAYAKAIGQWAKTDRIDARLLAEYAAKLHPIAQEGREERQIRL